jgi:hypothetical protein
MFQQGRYESQCFTSNSPYRESGYFLLEVTEIEFPAHRFRVAYTDTGLCLSTCPDGESEVE